MTRIIVVIVYSQGNSEDGFRTGCRNVSHKQQSFSGLQLPRSSFSIKVCYSWVQTIFLLFLVFDILREIVISSEKSRISGNVFRRFYVMFF